MSIIRVLFLVLASTAVAGTAYVGWYGQGGESFDLDRSVRTGSGGAFVGGRVK
ncbi:hypothetical protein [Cognatishimia sp. F0-27]|uniref:hypothetical protein n=1 Tax=Cognatishimia sp. F0-27 TaxID=2816855 RepID=UPI001D0C4DE1|nr:hypothetical protein [Cognatishimia sp. F0-27]MCC1493232.1 hypothetical protein [Cognatishimia sp. F0-27]